MNHHSQHLTISLLWHHLIPGSGGPTSSLGVLGCNLVFMTPTVRVQGFMNEGFWEFVVSSSSTLEDWGSPSLRIHCSPKPVDYLPVYCPHWSQLLWEVWSSTQISYEDSTEFVSLFFFYFSQLGSLKWEVSTFSISSVIFQQRKRDPLL